MSYSFPDMEQNVLEFWQTQNIFNKSLEKTKDGKPFTIYDGPASPVGLPHPGHLAVALAKDIIPRYQTMLGRYVDRRWGWNCHDLAVDHATNQKHEDSAISLQGYTDKCRTLSNQHADAWKRIITRRLLWHHTETLTVLFHNLFLHPFGIRCTHNHTRTITTHATEHRR